MSFINKPSRLHSIKMQSNKVYATCLVRYVYVIEGQIVLYVYIRIYLCVSCVNIRGPHSVATSTCVTMNERDELKFARMNVTSDRSAYVCDIDRRYSRRFYLLRLHTVT